jgi:membrane protein implicated in regulation of membrane protease activity
MSQLGPRLRALAAGLLVALAAGGALLLMGWMLLALAIAIPIVIFVAVVLIVLSGRRVDRREIVIEQVRREP